MKKNVTYKLKDDVASSTWIRFGREKIFVEHITQSTLENLHRNGYDSVETPPYNTMTNKYVEPVLITTSSYTRKTNLH